MTENSPTPPDGPGPQDPSGCCETKGVAADAVAGDAVAPIDAAEHKGRQPRWWCRHCLPFGRCPKRRFIYRALFVLLLMMVIAAGWVLRPHRLGSICAWAIERSTGTQVEVADARVGLAGSLEVTQVNVRVPGVAGDAGRLFHCPRITVSGGSLISLIIGRKADQITLLDPEIWIVEDLDEGGFVFQSLIASAQRDKAGTRHLPEIHARRAVVHRGQVRDGVYTALGDLVLSGGLFSGIREEDQQEITLTARLERDDSPITLRGRMAADEGRFEAELSEVPYSDTLRDLLPDALRKFDALHHPQGTLTQLQITTDASGTRAELTLTDAALDLPYGNESVRMQDVHARFGVSPDGIRIDDVTGRISDVVYHLRGHFAGLQADAPFNMTLGTDAFELPPDINDLFALPDNPGIQDLYDSLKPSGRFRFEGQLTRTIRAEPVDFQGTVHALDAKISYSFFAYPLTGVTGQVHLGNQSVEIDQMVGFGPNGNRILLDGSIAPPGPEAEIELNITADRMPIDAALIAAMDEPTQMAMDFLLSEEGWQRLEAAGHFAPGGDAEGFALDQSHTNASLCIRRDGRRGAPMRTYVRIDARDIAILLQAWPYPMAGSSGTVDVIRQNVRVRDVEAVGPTGARVRVNGWVLPGATTGSTVLDHVLAKEVAAPNRHASLDPAARLDAPAVMLRIEDVHLPADGLLATSIPGEGREWLEQLGVSGLLTGRGTIVPGPPRFENASTSLRVFEDLDQRQTAAAENARQRSGGVGFSFDAALTDARLVPRNSTHTVERIRAAIHLTESDLQIADLVGRLGTGGFEGHFNIGFATPTQPGHLDLAIVADDTPLDADLVRALPDDTPGAAALIDLTERYQMSGRARMEVNIFGPVGGVIASADPNDATSTASGPNVKIKFAPWELGFVVDDRRVDLYVLSGILTFDQGVLAVDTAEATFDGGSILLDGVLQPDLNTNGNVPADMELNVSGSIYAMTEAAEALLPSVVLRSLEAVEFEGPLEVTATRYVRRRGEWQVTSSFSTRDATMDLGVALRELSTDMTVTAEGGSGPPALQFNLTNTTAIGLDRRVEQVQATLANSPESPERLTITNARGVLAGGSLVTQGWFGTGDDTTYQLSFALTNAEVPALTRSVDDPIPANESTNDATRVDVNGDQAHVRTRDQGLASARLALTGQRDDIETLQGTGRFEVLGARLFEKPVTLAVLSAANFAAPTQSSFRDANGSFFLRGQTLEFTDLNLIAPQMHIEGEGTLELESQDLNLILLTRNPNLPDLGVLSILARAVHEEVLRIRVRGTLEDPQASVDPITGVWRAIGRVIAGNEAFR